MINENYKPSMKAELTKEGTIRITKQYLETIEPFNKADKEYLNNNLVGMAMCPGIYWLKDTPRTRKLLRYKAEDSQEV